eukprot:CAMPEP_0113939164 /NCGR_PEP_ID=MMETSP1339-20121228/5529_1 /TAXON_ID=94617 /ORGANISM="Fibrocapsa japonica" /LENGTH=160 /DNA_ID=CAMNT_0000942587 /DNA_START=33 /DNA_END=515 /DNA_ORIENTATION=- /assembly_acc=CAM_ASM_000762
MVDSSAPQISLRKAEYVKIGTLQPGPTHGHNLVGWVVKTEVVLEKPRIDGSSTRIAEVLLADETGCLVVRARNEQIDMMSPGNVVVVRNASIEMFKGYMRLVVTKWGKITAHPDGIESTPPAPSSTNTENNLSSVEYELVHLDSVETDGANIQQNEEEAA